MRSLSAFLKQNALPAKNKFVVISERFIDEDGKPMQWELRPIPEKENAKLREDCMKRDYSKQARKNGTTIDFDTTLYTQKLLAASVVYPDLKDSQLQGNYGVVGEDTLLVELLFNDEYALLRDEVDNFNSYLSRNQEEDKAEVKNS